MPNAVEAIGLSKRYGDAFALSEVSALVPEGRVVGLLGHNGAGKSTFIKLALGLIAPSAGRIRVLGQEPAAAARGLRARVGYLPENVAFYEHLTGAENIRYFEALKGAPRGQGAQLLDRVGLGGAAGRRVHTYSKGMRQRLGLAQALLGSPELFLLDEPTAGLDPIATRDFYVTVRELGAERRTVVISSHLLAELEQHIDRAIILGHGRLLAQGSVPELREMAGLPVTVAVRLTNGVNGFLHERWLNGLEVRRHAGEAGVVEIDVPAIRKMELVRQIVNVPNVADVEVRQPTLARLYEAVGSNQASATGRPS